MAKPRVIKDFDKLSDEIKEKLLKKYPYGFEDNLVSYTDMNGKKRSALPFEAEDFYYLIRMNEEEAVAAFNELDEDDDDYDSDSDVLKGMDNMVEDDDDTSDDDDEEDRRKEAENVMDDSYDEDEEDED